MTRKASTRAANKGQSKVKSKLKSKSMDVQEEEEERDSTGSEMRSDSLDGAMMSESPTGVQQLSNAAKIFAKPGLCQLCSLVNMQFQTHAQAQAQAQARMNLLYEPGNATSVDSSSRQTRKRSNKNISSSSSSSSLDNSSHINGVAASFLQSFPPSSFSHYQNMDMNMNMNMAAVLDPISQSLDSQTKRMRPRADTVEFEPTHPSPLLSTNSHSHSHSHFNSTQPPQLPPTIMSESDVLMALTANTGSSHGPTDEPSRAIVREAAFVNYTVSWS